MERLVSNSPTQDDLVALEDDKSEYCWKKTRTDFRVTSYVSSCYLPDELQDLCVKEFSMVPEDYYYDNEQDYEAAGEDSARTALSDVESFSGSYFCTDDTLSSSMKSETAWDSSSSDSWTSTNTAENFEHIDYEDIKVSLPSLDNSFNEQLE